LAHERVSLTLTGGDHDDSQAMDKAWHSVECGAGRVIVGCATIESPPEGLVAKNDHAALAAWYDKEAAHLRQHAKDMTKLPEEYRKNPEFSCPEVTSLKIDPVQHCESLALMYTQAAEKADLLAKRHRDMLK
jgi:hypothetical protein